ncbi:uncharacterized protein BJ212DRAFT_1482798 [Suillus subaureus]|uniref:Uncharacterized protein n=1 Tax=Suillus subaureus TaxID=48587 RepID=A0A9P7E7U3_9AGAM|nr:uncharacterized protein BJ212DRAFT_1482798 [Suillus subaureus]KAG1813344.1 hypothetical protein BJ212DRAFT_1482798 [Suillus subaureus]
MQHSRALAGLCNLGRCYKQTTRSYSTNSPFASFISDVKVPESVAASVEETRRSAPRLSSLGDIEIPSIIPSSTTSLFAARAAQRQKRLLAEAAPKKIEAKVVNTPKPTSPATGSLLSRRSQRPPKDEERRSNDGPSSPQTAAHPRLRRPLPAETRSAPAEIRSAPAEIRSAPAGMRTDRRRESSRVPKPSRVVKPTSPIENLNKVNKSAPPPLHVSFNNTDLSELFSSPALIPYVVQPSVAQSRIDSRMQLLKERAGDYSRYLSGGVESTTQTQGSIDYAKLILARRREVGLKPRRAAVELMRQAGLSSTSGMRDFTTFKTKT